LETSDGQQNWYYFDAWWRSSNGATQLLRQLNPWQTPSNEASRLFDTFCLTQQNNTRNRSDGKLIVRCYQWFPASSRWVACKNVVGFARGMCTSDESELGDASSMELEAPPSGSQPRATFRLECPAGCAPFPANQCQTILHRAVLDAISLANNAASKLTASPRSSETIRLFRFFFGHDPSRPVPWANNEQSGATVAKRFLMCARELGGGRRTLYRCGCPGAGPGVRAITINPREVSLCPRFWGASPQAGLSARFFRAGVILHEMLHQLFIEFILHDANERRRNNAHCYEAFAMRLAGHAADQSDVRQCRDQPA
jgi:hypothetical protein